MNLPELYAAVILTDELIIILALKVQVLNFKSEYSGYYN